MEPLVLGKIEILTLFKANAMKFLDSLIELFPEQEDFIAGRILLENDIPIEDLLVKIASRTLPYSEAIEKRDEKFFLNDLLGFSTQDKIIRIKNLWASKRLDNNDRKTIWTWVDFFVRLFKMYATALH